MARVNIGKWRDLKNELEDANEQLGLGEPPPSGLVPIGDSGLYATPDTPADPWDCTRWERSPYCGGNPIEPKLVGLDVETTVQVNPCGITRSATVNPTLFGISLPPVSIAHIPEACREEYEKQGDQRPPPPPPSDRDGYEPTPQYRPHGFDPDSQVCVVTQDYYYQEIREYYRGDKEWGVGIDQIFGTVGKSNYPTGEKIAWYNSNGKPAGSLATALASVQGTYTAYNFLNEAWVRNVWRSTGTHKQTSTVPLNLGIPPDYPTVAETMGYTKGHNYRVVFHYPTGNAFVKTLAVYVGRFGDIFPEKQISPLTNASSINDAKDYAVKTIHERFVVFCKKISGDSSDRRPPPLKKPKKECCDDMGCCQPPYGNRQQQDNNAILKLLREIRKNQGNFPVNVQLFDADENKPGSQAKTVKIHNIAEGVKTQVERTEKTSKMIGIDQFPMKLPQTVIENKDSNLLGTALSLLNPFKNVRITSVAQLNWWMFERLHEILGHWQGFIDVEDADPVKEGEQPKRVILPNISLTMREQIHLQTAHMKATGLILDCLIKVLIDLAGTKVLTAECAARIKDVQEYLDYPTNEKTGNVPTQITVANSNAAQKDRENLHKFLQPSHMNFVYDDWTGEHSLEEKLIDLLQAAVVLRGGS